MGWRTVRPSWADGPLLYFKLVPERVSVSVGFKVELRTVRPWGADGPPANISFVPEMLFLWFGLLKCTADGLPLGRGRSAG